MDPGSSTSYEGGPLHLVDDTGAAIYAFSEELGSNRSRQVVGHSALPPPFFRAMEWFESDPLQTIPYRHLRQLAKARCRRNVDFGMIPDIGEYQQAHKIKIFSIVLALCYECRHRLSEAPVRRKSLSCAVCSSAS